MDLSQPFTIGAIGAPSAEKPEKDHREKLPHGARWQDDGSVVLDLFKPVTQRFGDAETEREETTRTLHLQPLTGGDMIDAMGHKGASAATFLLARSGGLSGAVGEQLIRRLDARDFVRATTVIGVFTGNGQTTGQ